MIQLFGELELCFMDGRHLRSSATAVSVGHRREMGGTILPIVHDKCGSSSIVNTTDAEPFDQVARLAVGGSPHAASAVTLLFSGGSIRFVGVVSVVQMVGLWSSEICIGGRRASGSAWSSVMPQTPAGRPDACITSPSAPGQHRTVGER